VFSFFSLALSIHKLETTDGTNFPVIVVFPVLFEDGLATLGTDKVALFGVESHTKNFFTVGASFQPTKHLTVLLSIYSSMAQFQ
jgi:hypothetical protein